MDKTKLLRRVETTHKLGNTTYVVNGIYASSGSYCDRKIAVYLTEKRRRRRAKI